MVDTNRYWEERSPNNGETVRIVWAEWYADQIQQSYTIDENHCSRCQVKLGIVA